MQTNEIKRRIRSIGSTKQITRAMKFVATAKLNKAQERMLSMRPYAKYLDSVLSHICQDLVGDENELLRKPTSIKRAAIIVIAGDRGLCGGFNANVLRETHDFLAKNNGFEPVVYAIGKRAIANIRKTNIKILKSYHDVFEKLSYVLASDICEQITTSFLAKDDTRIDAAYIVYNKFVTLLAQTPAIKQILPIDRSLYTTSSSEVSSKVESSEASKDLSGGVKNTDEVKYRPVYELQPDPETALHRLISRRLATDVYQATLESYAAELAARMTAMDNATQNADDMIDNLTLIFNRARQAGITSDLLDIVGGANAIG